MNYKAVLLGLILLVLIAQPVAAWGPNTHVMIYEEMKKEFEFQSSPFKDTITNNEQYFLAGALVPDITVIYYYTKGGEYPATHNWAFVDCFTKKVSNQRELAFAYGMALGHLIPDSIAHNQYVPDKIRNMYIPNLPLHPLVEAQFEALILRDHPEIFQKTRTLLNPILRDEQLLDKLQECISLDYELDVRSHLEFLNEAIGDPDGFYTKQFHLPQIYESFAFGNPWIAVVCFAIAFALFYVGNRFDIWVVKWLFAAVLLAVGLFFLFGGIAAITSVQDLNYWVELTADESAKVSNQDWDNRFSYDPTGFSTLEQADNQIMWVWYLLTAIKIIIISFIVYWKWLK